MAQDQIQVETFDGTQKHVDSTIKENDFMDASKTLIYAATIKEGTQDTLTAFKKIGLVQSFAFSEAKELQQIYELGSDIPYSVPGRVRGSISMSRVILDGKDFLNAIYLGDETISAEQFLESLASINVPVYLMFVSSGSAVKSGQRIVSQRVFANCHITQRNQSVGAGQRILVESMAIQYTHILDAKVTTR